MIFQEIRDRFRGWPKPLIIIFYLLNFAISIFLYKIIKVKDFVKRRKILFMIVYSPLRWFSETFNKDILLYNNKWDYFFTLSDTSSYGVMMLSHEGNVPFIIYFLLRKIENPVFIDVGAHQGAYSIAFSKLSKLVIAVEPHPENYSLLKKNLTINRVKNCIPVRCALSNDDGISHLYTSELSDLHSLHQNMLNKALRSIPVTIKRLDTLVLQELKLEKIDLVKIDVEGAEVEVLEGMRKVMERHNPILMIEVFQRNLEIVERILKENSYDHIKRLYESIDPLTNEKYMYVLAMKQESKGSNLTS